MGNRNRDNFGGEKIFEGGSSTIKWFGTARERNIWLNKKESRKVIDTKKLSRGNW